jgi:hypothetical protein
MTGRIFQGFDQASQPIAKVRSMVRQATCTSNIGRCSSCDLESRQIQQRTRLIALFVGIGSWSRLNETNHQLALLRENLNNWSLLPADVSSWATIMRRSERVGATKQNCSDHTHPSISLNAVSRASAKLKRRLKLHTGTTSGALMHCSRLDSINLDSPSTLKSEIVASAHPCG